MQYEKMSSTHRYSATASSHLGSKPFQLHVQSSNTDAELSADTRQAVVDAVAKALSGTAFASMSRFTLTLAGAPTADQSGAALNPVNADLLDEILTRQSIKIGTPSPFPVPALIDLDAGVYPINAGPGSGGFIGGIIKAFVVTIFGEYDPKYLTPIATGAVDRVAKVDENECDIAMHFPTVKYSRTTDFDGKPMSFGHPFLQVSSAFKTHIATSDVNYTAPASTNFKDVLRAVMLAKKANEPSATTYNIGSFAGCTADFMSQDLVTQFKDELLVDTQLNLQSVNFPDDQVGMDDVGTAPAVGMNIVISDVNTPGQTSNIVLDAYGTDDWYALFAAGEDVTLKATVADRGAFAFFNKKDMYCPMLPAHKQCNRLATATMVAVGMLKSLQEMGIHSQSDWDSATEEKKSPFLKTVFGIDELGKKILDTCGSMKTLEDIMRNDVALSGYEPNTGSVWAPIF